MEDFWRPMRRAALSRAAKWRSLEEGSGSGKIRVIVLSRNQIRRACGRRTKNFHFIIPMCTKRIGIYDIMKKIYPREAGERRNDMPFKLPEYHHPDFSLPQFVSAPEVKWELVKKMELHRNISTVHPCIRNILRSAAGGCWRKKAAWIPAW